MRFFVTHGHAALTHKFVLSAMVLMLGFVACERRQAVGTDARPLKILTFPGLRGAEVERAFSNIENKLRVNSSLFVKIQSPVDYFEAVRALGDAEADLAFLNDMGFIAGQKLYGIKPCLQVLRNGQKANHRAQILIKPGIGTDISALAGRRMAYVDPHSLSGYFLVEHALKKNKIKLGTAVFAGSHLEALRQVLSGQADALATYADSFEKAGLAQDMRAALSPQELAKAEQLQSLVLDMRIPNEPVVKRKDLNKDSAKRIVAALLKLASDKQMSADLLLMAGVQGFKPASAKDYATLQNMLKDLGKGAEEALPGGWKLRSVHSEKIQ